MSISTPNAYSPGSWSRGLLESVPDCPACRSSNREPVDYRRRDDSGIMPDRWHMVQCADCHSLYLDPKPDAESLPRAYSDYYTHQADLHDAFGQGNGGFIWHLINGYLNRRFGMRRRPSNSFGFHIFSMLEPWRLKLDYYGRHLSVSRCPQRGRLLDIGCGNGAFLLRAKSMGWNVVGCEPDLHAAEAARSMGLQIHNGDVLHTWLEDASFDVITMSHVLEHLEDPLKVLQRACALLRPGGFLWLALPNPSSFGLGTFKAAWRGLHFPFHICIPSQLVLGRWLTTAGFSRIQWMRRGSHSRTQWRESESIANRESIEMPARAALVLKCAASDLVATISARWAEESVLIAYKPVVSHARAA